MNELDGLILEGREFIIADEIKINNTLYVQLSSVENLEHFCIRKVVEKNGEQILTGLDSDEEFDIALAAFIKKNHKDLEN